MDVIIASSSCDVGVVGVLLHACCIMLFYGDFVYQGCHSVGEELGFGVFTSVIMDWLYP